MRNTDFNFYSKQTKNGLRYHGDYTYCGIRFSFSLNEQKDGRFRGRITVISPHTAKPMDFNVNHPYASSDSKEKKVKHPYASSGSKAKQVKYREISFQSSRRSAIKAYIQKTAQKIYADNAFDFSKLIEKTASPSTVYPELAGGLYGQEYIRFRFNKNQSEDSLKKKLRRLSELLAALPFKPMVEIQPSEIHSCMKKRTKNDYSLLHDFWDYCILHHYCTGNNPINIPVSNGPSSKAKQEKIQKLTRVPAQNLKMMNSIAIEKHDGPSCGVMLMESGISAKVACSLRWRDITWPSDKPYYALVKLDRPDVMCAIHNYTRPLLPIAAMVLHTRYEELSKQYSPDDLPNMRVVSAKSDAEKEMNPSTLVQESRRLLIQAGIHENKLIQAKESRNDAVSARILGETYKDILISTCGVQEGSGSYKFLLGQSISNDVSSTNYLSFTSPPGSQHLYKYLLASAPKTECQQPLSKEAVDGSDVLRVLPDSSDRCAGLIFDAVLQPGEEMILEAETGVTGRIEAFSLPDETILDSLGNEDDGNTSETDDDGFPPIEQPQNDNPVAEP